MNQQDKERLRELARKAIRGVTYTDYGSAILALLEENERLAKDAARYRWLRFGDTELLVPYHTEDGIPVGAAFDEAVDAAMQHKGV